MRDLVTPSTQTHTHTNECYTHTHTKEVEEMRRARRIPSEGSSQAHPQRQPRREDQKMKVGGDVVSSSDEGCIRRLAAAQQLLLHRRGDRFISGSPLDATARHHTRGCKSNETRGASHGTVFFHRARERFRLSRYFQGCRRPVRRLRRRHAHMHTRARDVAVELHRPPAPLTFDKRRRRVCSGAH